MKNGEGKSRGFGFVCFKNEVDAAVAKRDMNEFEIGGKKFDISFAQKKENREAFLTAQKKGILKQVEEVRKLPLEQRIVRRPTKCELQTYCSVPCLEQISPYGQMHEWQRTRLISNSMMKMPSLADVSVRTIPPPQINFMRQHTMDLNRNEYKQNSGNHKIFRSQSNLNHHQQSRFGNTGATKKTDSTGHSKPLVHFKHEKEESASISSKIPQEGRKEVLQDILMPQLKKMYPPYANELLELIMEREYKDILRLIKNHRLLYKTANNEVQKIKAKANGARRSAN